MSPKRHYLQCIKGHYRYRRRWPKHVASKVEGEFFIRHLGTSSLEEAVQSRPLLDAAFVDAVKRLERSTDTKPRELPESEAFRLVSRWLAEEEDFWTVGALSPRSGDQQENELEFLSDQIGELEALLGRNDYSAAETQAAELLAKEGIKAEPGSVGYRRLLQLMMRAWRELALRKQSQMIGTFDRSTGDPDIAEALGRRGTVTAAPKHTLGDLLDAFRKDKESGWSASTRNAYQPIFRLLTDTLGNSRDLATIKRPEGRELFELVKALPKGIGKTKALQGLTVPQAVEKARQLGLPTLQPKSINDSYMTGLSSIFRWAVKEQWMDANPVEGLRVHDPVPQAEKRDPFTLDQLKTMFAGEPWDGEGRAAAKPIHYWGPLIALFHGMRRGEIAALDLDGVVEQEGHPVMLIRKGKTHNARRKLPVHPELLRMGFWRFVEERREQGGDRLFVGERPNKNGQWGDGLSDWFLRLLDKRGIAGTMLGMHSFRHNWQDRIREAGLHGTAIAQELAGRTKGGDASNDYGSGHSTAMLAEAIAKVRYPELDLSHLYVEDAAN